MLLSSDEKIYIGKELRGYTMKLVKGPTLANIRVNEKLRDQALKDLQTIRKLYQMFLILRENLKQNTIKLNLIWNMLK